MIVTLWYLLGVLPIHARGAPYLEEVLESAHQQKLHEDPYWHILLHYKTSARGSESLVDDPGYFLAPDGKTNPEAELKATIRAFFDPQDEGKKAAVCRFVARYEWIKERLHLDCNRLPAAECLPFQDFMNKIRPESVTLIFPMAHLNSPASMFGHTLLTIETANKSKLLAYAVSYSAVTDETFGPFFAVKGLFGLYPGYFSVLPYYAKLQEYSDVDHRDIWEYPLNLTEQEIRRMMLHIHELDHIASDYYFFNENCSYLLFYLLEAARPTVTLTGRFHGWLIPLDSIRMIEDQGFITGALYRPSRTTKIKYLASRIPEEGQERALALARGEREGDFLVSEEIPDQEKRKTCELAGEYLQYLYTKGKVPEEVYQERFLKILQARSRLGTSKDESLHQILPPVQPDKGHHSNRFAFGIGAKGHEFFEEIRIRPAYHHLMDSDDGYVEGAQLIFTDLALRHYPSDHKLALEGLDIIDIVSLSPRDRFFHPTSWKIKTGFTRIQGEDDEDLLVYEVNPGGGFAFENDRMGLMYGMLETNLNLSGGLKHNYAAGAGGSVGVIRHMSGFWKAHLFVRDLSYGLGDRSNVLEAAMLQNFAITPDLSISLELKREKSHRFYRTETKALVNLFF